jgi:protein gp37
MAEVTGIAWTDSTFNPWIGCTKVGPGCDHCYAEALDKRHRWQGDTHWGAGKPRMRTSAANWRKPLGWNKKAEASGKPWRVFCASLADVFDNEVPETWRMDLLDLIQRTPNLTWLLLTKRIGLARRYMPSKPLPNVWLGATIVNQEEADRDVPKLLETPATVHFVSYEPALGPVDWTAYPGIDWIIVGGESTQGAKAREFKIEWAHSTIADATDIFAAPFVKQLGSGHGFKDRAGADPAEWPPELRVQEFPECSTR